MTKLGNKPAKIYMFYKPNNSTIFNITYSYLPLFKDRENNLGL